jgi:hypothetical protein
MPSKNDPDKLKGPSADLRTGPGGLTLRQIHDQVKRSYERDRLAEKTANKLAQKQNRWQRFVRYVWDRKPK